MTQVSRVMMTVSSRRAAGGWALASAFILVGCAFLGRPARADYNKSAAVGYANAHWLLFSLSYRLYGDDCADFVSQCLLAGGFTQDTQWGDDGWWVRDPNFYYYGPETSSPSWRVSGSLWWYLYLSGRATVGEYNSGQADLADLVRGRATLSKDGPGSLTNYQNLEPGDVVQFSWNGDGSIDHTAIVTAKDSGGMIYESQHTPSEHNHSLADIRRTHPRSTFYYWHLDSGPATSGVLVRNVDGMLLKESHGHGVYVLVGGAALSIPSPEEFSALHYNWNALRVVDDGLLSNLSPFPRDGTVFRERSDTAVYVMSGGSKHWVPGVSVLNYYGGWGAVRVIPNGSVKSIPRGYDLLPVWP